MQKNYYFLLCLIVMVSCAAPKALEYRGYENFKVETLGFTNSQIAFDLELYNPNNFSLLMKEADMDVFVNNSLLGHTSSDSLFRISKRSAITIPVMVNLEMKNILRNAWDALAGKELDIRVEGKIKTGKSYLFLNIPIKYETQKRVKLF